MSLTRQPTVLEFYQPVRMSMNVSKIMEVRILHHDPLGPQKNELFILNAHNCLQCPVKNIKIFYCAYKTLHHTGLPLVN